MKTRCPCCGAENSLDALLAHDEARDAMLALMQAGGETARLAVQYVALFRSGSYAYRRSCLNAFATTTHTFG